MRRNAGWCFVGTAGLVAIFVFYTWAFWPSAGEPGKAYLVGVVHAALICLWVFGPFLAFLAISPPAIHQLRGAWGEDNTRDELKRAKRRRVIWGSVDSVPFDIGDLDHLVVTRRGGLVAIDSKWRGDTRDVAHMAADARRARLRAEALAHSLLERERAARHRGRGKAISVRSVIVVWGALQSDVPDDASYEGVEFIAGRRLRRWLRGLDGHPVPKEAAQDLLRKVQDYQSRYQAKQKAKAPQPRR